MFVIARQKGTEGDVWLDGGLPSTSRRSLFRLLVNLTIACVGLRPVRALALQPPDRLDPSAVRFFTPDELAFVTAAVDRLLPDDERGPGGVAAEVPRYIDFQLAGPWGSGENRFVAGPVKSGAATLGDQSITPRAAFYRASIAALRALPGGSDFSHAEPAARDAFLESLQQGEHDSSDLNGAKFFAALLEDSVSGFLSDPSYGGNAGFAGWKLIGYPGVRYDWTPYLQNNGRPLDMPIVGTYGPADGYGLE
jgi:gluconate 2-dehydrogenase gamma chain